MTNSLARRWIKRLRAAVGSGSIHSDAPRIKRPYFAVEMLEDRTAPANFTAGNIAVLDLAAASTNTTGSILELSPSAASQAAPVQTISIGSTGTNAIRFSDSGTSSFLSDSNDGSLLAFSAYNTTTSSGNLASLNPRAVGTLNSSGTFNLATSYNVSGADLTAGNQTRSATSLDDTNWYITDKGGLYTNGATTPSLATNILDAKSFGGAVYISSTKATAGVSTASSPTASSLSGLPGLPADGSIQDFYLVQSGSNGSTYDVLYTLDQGSTSATINKFSLVSGSWVSNGSTGSGTPYTLAANGEAMIAENDGNGGAFLFVTTTNGTANNSLVRLTDSAGFNSAINITTANNVTLYTDTASDLLKGIAFVPAVATAPTVSNPTKTDIGINSATLGGTVTGTGSQYVSAYGIVYSLTSANSNPTIGGTGVTQVPGSGVNVFSPFTVSATGLVGTSAYSYAAYATNSVGTSYSSVDTFTTNSANPPTIDTPTDTSITTTSATLGATVESNGGATITKTGVVYSLTSTNGNPQIGGAGVTEVDTGSPVASGAFTVSATGLSPGGSYTFEAFATNGSGTTYTAATAFTTLAPPTVTTPTFAAVTSSAATLGGNVTSNGGSSITKRGVVYALTSVNSNPQVGGTGVTELDDAAQTTGVFTESATGLSASTSYTFEAFATNANGTTYTAATAFTTAAPGIITSWTFPAIVAAPDNSPTPTYGTGTLTTLGMTNSYTNASGTGNTASDDVLSTSGSANPNFTENTLRVRGTPNNGWALAAPQFSQGIELDASTVGYSNIVFAFDWYSTTQGIRDLQVQYNTGSGWVNYQGPSPTGTFVTGGNDYYNSAESPANPTIYINLSGIVAANNNADLGIRLVSAYDSTGTLGNVYASATSTPGNIVPYNNSSGNWRFGNLTFFGNSTTTTTTVSAGPAGSQNLGKSVTFTATVTPASGTQFASGTVAFFDGNTQIGATQNVTQVGSTNVGTASITLTTLAAGIHGDITAQYTPASGNNLIASGSSMNLVAGPPTNNPISYVINAPQATGVDVSPVVGQPFTGVVATFSDGTDTNPTGFTATITWASGQTTNGVIAFAAANNETNINGQIVAVRLFTVTGTFTYATAGTYPVSVTITDPGNNSATVGLNARVAYAPLAVTATPVNAVAGAVITNQTVATFTDPGLVANLTALGISDPTTQYSASINWGDTSAASTGAISYNSTSHIFSVIGSHTYTQAGSYSISVAVTPLTVSVSRVDSSDPNSLNEVGDENGNGITDSPSAAFIDQFALTGTSQSSLYTFSLPTVQTTSGNEALTYSSFSKHEGALNLSTNGQYLVIGGYNLTADAYGPQSTFSNASVINRVIGTISGAGVINTTTALTDAYSGDNFRDVVSTNGTQFWTAGNATDSSNNVHYATLGASTSTIVSGLANANDIAIFNGQLYAGLRQPQGAQPAGIYQIGTGLGTTAGQTPTLFIQIPQANALDATDSGKSTSPSGLFMADLNDGNPTINGVNVAYIADSEMGIARYDYTSTGWHFSYYVNSTGSFLNSAYTVDSSGNVTPTGSFNAANPAASADATKAGGVRELTGRVVNGQVQLFAVTGFGTGANPSPTGGTAGDAGGFANSVISLTDTGANSTFTVLATNTGASIYDGIAFTPTQTITGSAQVISVTNPGTQTFAVSSTVSLRILASSLPTGASYAFSATGLPAGLAINPATGVIHGTITAAANSYAVTVTAADSLGGSTSQAFTFNVVALTSTITDQAFVLGLYTSVLHRAGNLSSPTDAGYWISQLNSGMSMQAVANGVAHSTEALNIVIDNLFIKLLDRPVDSVGQPFYLNFLQNGGTVEAATASIVGSTEYQKLVGTGGFVQSLYKNLLGRLAANSELSYWNSLLPTIGAQAVATGFVSSIEFRADAVQQFFGFLSIPTESVESTFPDLLHRTSAPGTAEISYWQSTTFDILGIEVRIISSPEYESVALGSTGVN